MANKKRAQSQVTVRRRMMFDITITLLDRHNRTLYCNRKQHVSLLSLRGMFLIPSINICKNTTASRAAARAVPTASRGTMDSYQVVLDLISSRWVQIH